MGIPLLAGRTFADRDVEKAPPSPSSAPRWRASTGRARTRSASALRFDDDPKDPWITVVGMVGDVRQLGLERGAAAAALHSRTSSSPLPFTNVAVRSTLPPGTVASLLRSAAGGDRSRSAVRRHHDAAGRARQLGRRAALPRDADRRRSRCSRCVLAAVGVYGLISYTVAQRTREIGIRVALGAQPRQVLCRCMREGLMLALAGIGDRAGRRASPAARVLAAFLFGVGAERPADVRRRRAAAAGRRAARQLHPVTPRVARRSDCRLAR